MFKKPQGKESNKIEKKQKKKAGLIEEIENDCIEQLKDLTAIKDLAQKITSTLSLNQVIASAYEHILSTIAPDLVVIYLLDEDKLITQGEKPENPIFKQESPDIKCFGQCLCGLVAKDGEPIYSIDIHTDHRCTLNECKKAGLISFAALPLIVDRDIQGVLGIGSFTRRDFSHQASFLEMLSLHIAIAIKNAMLHEKLGEYSQKQIKNVLRKNGVISFKQSVIQSLF
jgi:GAF domain-containing protein